MRTKIGKRIGPVPIALVAVLALAAFISAGLWLVPNGQTVEAQGAGNAPATKCQVDKNNNDNTPADSATNQLAVSIADNCFATGNTATVEFQNETTGEVTRHIYTDGRITGGINLKVHFAGTNATAAPATAGISYYALKVPAQVQGSSDPGTATITVNRNGNPQIRLDAYTTVPTFQNNDFSEIATLVLAGAGDTIVFSPGLDTPDAGASSVVVNEGKPIDEGDDEADVSTIFKDAASADFDMVWGSDAENAIAVVADGSGVAYNLALVGDLASFLVPGAVITISAGDYEREITLAAASRTGGDITGTGGTEPEGNDDIEVTASLSRDVGGTVTVTVGGGDDDVMLEAGLSRGKSLTMTAKQARTPSTGLKVVGLPETGNIRVEVSAELSGDTGTLTEKGYAIRSNDVVDSVSAKTYSCKQDDVTTEMMPDLATTDDDDDLIPDPLKICVVEAMESTTVSKLTESATFAPGSKFLIIATVADSAGNPLDTKPVTVRQAAGPSRAAISSTSADTNDKGMARLTATIKGDADADGGTYTLNVSRGSVRTTVDVNVAGDVSMLSFPEGSQTYYIPANTGVGSFTVRASDENDNLPINVGDGADDFEALISVRPSKSLVLGENKIQFDAKTGEATFFVQVSDEAQLGDTVTITVTAIDDSGIAPAVLAVTYNNPPTEPGMPTNVMAEATSDTMITVTWDAADDGNSDITGYVLQRKTGMMDFMTIAASSAEIWWNTLNCPMMNAAIPDDATPAPPADDTDMTSPYCAMYAGLSAEATTVVDDVFADEYGTISGTSHSDMGLMAETTYYYRVSATNSVGMGEYSDGMAMTMTMMMPSMELGAAMDLTAMANDGGSITLMWTPGDNATHHFVSGNSLAVWEFGSGMSSHTVSPDKLVSGTEYTFYVISGRFMEADDGTWPGEWSSAGWTNADRATAQ